MEIRYDPFDSSLRDDPYPTYRALRDEVPVYWAEETRAFVISRHEDVAQVLRRPDRFSSDAMSTMLIGMQPGTDPSQDPTLMAQIAKLVAALPFDPQAFIRGRNLIAADPPVHDAMRQLVNRGFTPRRIRAWEKRVQELVDDCMQRLRSDASFDLVADLAIPLPVTIIAEMLGVEPERQRDFKRWSDALVAGVSGSARGPDLAGSFVDGMAELCGYLHGVVESRRAAPGDDLIGDLLRAEVDGERLTTAEVVLFAILLLVAGNETTTNLIGNAVGLLLDHPDQLERVRRDRGLVPQLVEEVLRFESPIQFLFRRAIHDVEIAGTRIPADAGVIPLLGSANRDERRFEAPERFDVARDARGHVAFGLGVHFCLGASLARIEARAALEGLLDVLPGLARESRDVDYLDSSMVRGPRRLALRRAA